MTQRLTLLILALIVSMSGYHAAQSSNRNAVAADPKHSVEFETTSFVCCA